MYQMKIHIYIGHIDDLSSQEDIDFGLEIRMISYSIYKNKKLGCDFMPYVYGRNHDGYNPYNIVRSFGCHDAVLENIDFLSGKALINIANFKDFEPYDKLAKAIFIHHTSRLSEKERDEFTQPPQQVIIWDFQSIAEFNEVVR